MAKIRVTTPIMIPAIASLWPRSLVWGICARRRVKVCPRCKDAAASSGSARAPCTGSCSGSARQRTAAKYQEDSHGIPDGAHTHGSGGGGLGVAVLVVRGGALAVRLAGPVVAAAAEVVYALGIVVAATVGGVAVALIVAQAWRWRRRRLDAARAEVLTAHLPLRAAQPLLHSRRAIERPREVHLHLHGVSAAELAAIVRQQQEER
jgi:hypothetical protein